MTNQSFKMGRPKPFCIVCSNNNVKTVDSKKTLWKFPNAPEAREVWIKALKLQDSKLTLRAKVCDLHFSRSQFLNSHLKRGAVPSLNARLTTAVTNSKPPIPITPKPSQNGLVLLLAAPPVPLTPVPLLQLPPNQTSSLSPIQSGAAIGHQSKSELSIAGPPTFEGPVLPNVDNDNLHPPPDNESEEPEPIPESLKQFLQSSLRKEVAEKVLKNLQTVKRFCGRLVSEIENADTQNKNQRHCQQLANVEENDDDDEEEEYLHPQVKLDFDDPLVEQKNMDIDKDEMNGENYIKTEDDSSNDLSESVLGLGLRSHGLLLTS